MGIDSVLKRKYNWKIPSFIWERKYIRNFRRTIRRENAEKGEITEKERRRLDKFDQVLGKELDMINKIEKLAI